MNRKTLIAHRGNTDGPMPADENSPAHVEKALNSGYDVEVDVWYSNGRFYLGHEAPVHGVELKYLKSASLWCHAKNLLALKIMIENDINCFWHQTDDFTITSTGHIWTFPRKPVCDNSIIVCKTKEETVIMNEEDVMGICSDYVGLLK